MASNEPSDPLSAIQARDIDRLLHDADRAVMGAQFARRMGHVANAAALDREAKGLYGQALNLDIYMVDPAWAESGNRDDEWLRRNGFARIAALSIGGKAPHEL